MEVSTLPGALEVIRTISAASAQKLMPGSLVLSTHKKVSSQGGGLSGGHGHRGEGGGGDRSQHFGNQKWSHIG
jgi:hypothetical protein